jgi:hypothetical protein
VEPGRRVDLGVFLVGLGDVEVVDIEVHWPGGAVSRHDGISTRQVLDITRTVW